MESALLKVFVSVANKKVSLWVQNHSILHSQM